MTTTLNQSQADLPRLVELASQGEDVVITVDGKPKARLTKAASPAPAPRTFTPAELQTWMVELEMLRTRYATGKNGSTVEEILAEDRDAR